MWVWQGGGSRWEPPLWEGHSLHEKGTLEVPSEDGAWLPDRTDGRVSRPRPLKEVETLGALRMGWAPCKVMLARLAETGPCRAPGASQRLYL